MTCDKTSEQQRAALQSQIFKIANDVFCRKYY